MNIAEILKDCPKGTKLYSPIFGDVFLDKVRPHIAIVVVVDKGINDSKEEFLYDGRYGMNGECLLFPSKENRDWNKFQKPFKDGDIISNDRFIAIFHRTDKPNNCVSSNVVYYHCFLNIKYGGFKAKIDYGIGHIEEYKYAAEEEKQKLFNAIKENGYKWNAETKTLEKLIEPKFKVGDTISYEGIVATITDIEEDFYTCTNGCIAFKYQDNWELVKGNIKPKFKIGDRIKHKLTGEIYIILHVISNGYGGGVYDVAITNEIGKSIDIKEQDSYELALDKFDISTLKPFDKVLVRLTNNCIWMPKFFSYYDINSNLKYYPFIITDNIGYPQCVPYEGNEHLLGTTDNCDEFYKTWE